MNIGKCLAAAFLLAPPFLAAAEPSARITEHFEIYGVRDEASLRFVKKLGFNRVILDDRKLIPAAERLGFGIVLPNWWNSETTWEDVEKQLKIARKIQGLISVNMMDEPIFNDPKKHPPSKYAQLRGRIRDAGFSGALSMTIHGPSMKWSAREDARYREYLEAIDILRIDPYPIVGERPLKDVSRWMIRARELMGQRRLPLTVILQASMFNKKGHEIREPIDLRKVRVNAYQAMLLGASSISFFSFDVRKLRALEGFESDFKRLLKELKRLRKKLRGWELSPSLSRSGLLHAQARRSGRYRCFVVNTTENAAGALPPLGIRNFRGRCPGR